MIGEEINDATLVNILQQDKLIVLSLKQSFISQLNANK
jgi:hypothetical protein